MFISRHRVLYVATFPPNPTVCHPSPAAPRRSTVAIVASFPAGFARACFGALLLPALRFFFPSVFKPTAHSLTFDALSVSVCPLRLGDNTHRTQYEAIFNECKKQPDMLCLQLVRTLRTSQATETREMSSILLRRVLTKDEVSLWANLQAQTQDGIKGELLKSLQEETTKSITRKVCDTVCELAAGIFEEGKWPELLPFLFQCVTAGGEPLKEAALNIFAQLAEYIGDSLVPHLATLHGILAQCLQGGEMSVRLVGSWRFTRSLTHSLVLNTF